ncbi:MAG: hypothetical protein ACO23H_19595 [Alphaproteobacteria bacterium]
MMQAKSKTANSHVDYHRGVTTIFSTNNIAPQSLSYAGNDFALASPDADGDKRTSRGG